MNKGSEEHGLPAPWMIEPQYPGVKENPVKPERGLFPWSIELVPYEGATYVFHVDPYLMSPSCQKTAPDKRELFPAP